jgi:hypothetical protein
MHDQSASRLSGRTRMAVSAMCVRALRITVLKSAGNFTRDECHHLNAENVQRVKCFMYTRCGIFCVLAIFERRRGRLGSKISGYGQLAEVAVYFAMSGLPPPGSRHPQGRRLRPLCAPNSGTARRFTRSPRRRGRAGSEAAASQRKVRATNTPAFVRYPTDRFPTIAQQ